MKYIRLKRNEIILFPEHISHDEIVILKENIISAGFCEITYGNGLCVDVFGESISLNKKSLKEDSEIIKKWLLKESFSKILYRFDYSNSLDGRIDAENGDK